MIAAILRRRIGPAVVLMIVALHYAVIILMLLRILLMLIIRMVLSVHGQWDHGRKRARRHGENCGFPIELLHGHGPFVGVADYEPLHGAGKSQFGKSHVSGNLRRPLYRAHHQPVDSPACKRTGSTTLRLENAPVLSR